MEALIRKQMMTLDATIHPFVRRDGQGSKEFGTGIPIKCYAEGRIQLVTNNLGAEVVSSKQLYIEGNIALDELSNITFEGVERPIKSISTFYKNALPEYKVVYL